MKKLKLLFTVFLLTVLATTFVSASYQNVTMSVVEEPISTIKFGTNSMVERKIISKDLENKEITIQIKAVNDEEKLKPTGEIMLVIDNSKSMLDTVSGTETREDLVIKSAKNLISNLLENNENLKIGAVSFSTNTDVSKEGTLDDAKLVSDLTNKSDDLLSLISNIEYTGPRTDLNAGIELAKKYFTTATDLSHKYIIILTDGVPNVAVNYDKNYYSDDVITKTKNSLLSLSSITGSNVITMLTGISTGDSIAVPSSKTYDEIIESIFGTPSKPTIGKFYYISDSEIESTIGKNIYNDLLPVSQSFTNLKIVDYISKEIADNYTFSYVKTANMGTLSDTLDKETNSIVWNIPELKSGETAIVQYKLKLKENYSSSIVDKVLNTNTKLDLNYTDYAGATNTKTSDVTPKVKLTEPQEVLPQVLPKAGSHISIGIFIALGITFVVAIKYFRIKNLF